MIRNKMIIAGLCVYSFGLTGLRILLKDEFVDLKKNIVDSIVLCHHRESENNDVIWRKRLCGYYRCRKKSNDNLLLLYFDLY